MYAKVVLSIMGVPLYFCQGHAIYRALPYYPTPICTLLILGVNNRFNLGLQRQTLFIPQTLRFILINNNLFCSIFLLRNSSVYTGTITVFNLHHTNTNNFPTINNFANKCQGWLKGRANKNPNILFFRWVLLFN